MVRKRNLGSTKVAKEPMCLVGYGKHSLANLMENVNTPEGDDLLLHAIDRQHWPPRYRPQRICSEEEKQAFVDYMLWINEKFKEKD